MICLGIDEVQIRSKSWRWKDADSWKVLKACGKDIVVRGGTRNSNWDSRITVDRRVIAMEHWMVRWQRPLIT